MKKFIFLNLAIFYGSFLFAQVVIPNGDFEKWNVTKYDKLDYYESSNDGSYLYENGGTPNMSKVTDAYSGSYAIKLETVAYGQDTIFAYFVNGNTEDMSGGIPYAAKPTALTGYYKGNIMQGDSALILVVFKLAGNVVSMDSYKIPPGNYPNYTQFTLPLNIPNLITPDTVIFGATSSDAFNEIAIPGSVMYYDNFQFQGVMVPPLKFNGGFEEWSVDSSIIIKDWIIEEMQLRTEDAYSGNYAAKIFNKKGKDGKLNIGRIINFKNENDSIIGGVEKVNNIDTLAGYYKFIRTGLDSAIVSLSFTNDKHTSYHMLNKFLHPVNSYTYFEIPYNLGITAPNVYGLIEFKGCNFGADIANLGNELFIDHVFFKSELITGNQEKTPFSWNNIVAYPSPAYDVVNIIFKVNNLAFMEMFDINGKKVYSKSFTGNNLITHRLQVDTYEKGIYFIKITSGEKIMSTKIIVQ